MLDSDLAELYQVPAFRLNEAVKRNNNRFPPDFMFQLTQTEVKSLTSQIAMSKQEGRGGRRTLPYAFTEHGVVMLSAVLNSIRAIQMNIVIVRAFIQLRQILAENKIMTERIHSIEQTQKEHGTALIGVIRDIQKIKNPPTIRAIGFKIR